MDISIVVPVFNEVESIEALGRSLHETLSRSGRTYEIILVDDGSTDGSFEAMATLRSELPHLRVIQFRRNFGQTAAISAGFTQARGEVVVTMDADLQNDPGDIPRLLEEMTADTDVVSGWRKKRQDAFFSRRVPSQLANALISAITGVKLHDYGCTLKAYRRDIVRDIRLYGEMHRFLPALASWVGGRVKEIPVTHHPRRFGTSKYGLSRISRVVLDLMTVKFLMRFSTRPIHVFGKWGLISAAAGLAVIAVMVIPHLSFQLFGTTFAADLIKRPFWIMSAFMLIFFSLQFISIGLLAELQIRTYHESQNKPIYVIRTILG
ncbi:MAG: glycosyltransferase family 2 protein [Candidatus Erginobacter occultus]|nr:glycosyltransferase family 2 protein [Candidatus Erginobacter occultus]